MRSAPKRGTGVVGVAAAVLLAGGLLAGWATSDDPTAAGEPEPQASAAAQSGSSPSSKPADESKDSSRHGTSGSADSSAGGNVGTQRLEPVEVGKTVVVENGTEVWVTSVREVEVEGRGPGEIHGPGVAVTVKIKNGSTSPLDMNGTAVNAFFGDLPASPSSASPYSPVQGELKPGKTAQGTYVFMKPEGSKGSVHVEVQNTAWPQVVEVHQ